MDGDAVRSLRRELQLLASPGATQLEFLPAFVARADELALRFDDAMSFARTRLHTSTVQREALDRLDSALKRLSADADRSVWSDAAVSADPRWQVVRDLAREALVAFDWPFESPPPDDTGAYVQ